MDSMPQQNPPSASLNSREFCSNCARPMLLVIIMWMLTLTIIISIVWIVINPHNPDFKLNTISVSNVTLPDSHFRGTYDVEFIVNNTNKRIGLFVDHVKTSVLFKHEMVSDKTFEESVYIRKMSQGKLQVHFGEESVHKMKKGVFKDLSDAWSKKIMDFQVKIQVRIRFEYKFLPTKVRFVQVLCRNVAVEFRSTKGTGKLLSGGNCTVQ